MATFPDEIEDSDYEPEVLRDNQRHVELWTDGEWIRLGHDVRNGDCLTYRYEDHDDLVETFRQLVGAEQVSLRHHKYVLTDGVNSYDVFRNRDFVLEVKSDLKVLHRAHDKAYECRRTFDPEAAARSYVESLRELPNITRCEERGQTERVSVTLLSEMPTVQLGLVDDLRNDEHVLGDPSISTSEDGIEYDFTVDVSDLTSGEATAESAVDDETADALRDAVDETVETFGQQMRDVPTIGTPAAENRIQAVHDALEDLRNLADE